MNRSTDSTNDPEQVARDLGYAIQSLKNVSEARADLEMAERDAVQRLYSAGVPMRVLVNATSRTESQLTTWCRLAPRPMGARK